MTTWVGTLGNDSFTGDEDDRVYYGLDGNDIIRHDASTSGILYGGRGNDVLAVFGGEGRLLTTQYLYGDDGNDTLLGGTGLTTHDRMYGGEGDDRAYGYTGNDILNGGGGFDLLYGGADADRLDGGDGDDTLYGGDGDDLVVGHIGNDLIYGDAGVDRIDGGDGVDSLYGGDGDDRINGGEGIDALRGGLGDDLMTGHLHEDFLYGENGADRLYGQDGDDILRGDDGDDLLDGGADNDTLLGGAGNDVMRGGEGDDIYTVEEAGDRVLEHAGEGVDTVQSTISYTLGANVENLALKGSSNKNGIGNELDNEIIGTFAINIIAGKGGADRLTGGGGADVFDYNAVSESAFSTYDRIMDLEAIDRIDLSGIDANTTVAGNQAFVLADTFAVGQAGRITLTWNSGAGFTVVAADVDGDAVADMRIVLYGDHREFVNFVL